MRKECALSVNEAVILETPQFINDGQVDCILTQDVLRLRECGLRAELAPIGLPDDIVNQYVAEHFNATTEDHAEVMQRRIDDPHSRLVIARMGLEAVGYCYTKVWEGEDRELVSIAITDRVRRSGIGTIMLRDAIAFNPTEELLSTGLIVMKHNKSAQAFYEREGFRAVSEVVESDFIGGKEITNIAMFRPATKIG